MSRASRVVVFCLSLVTLLVASATCAQKLQLPPHQKVTLKNGMTVLLLPKPGIPLVNVVVIVKSGALADPPGHEGLASMTAELLHKGTKTRTAQQFAQDVDFIGGRFDVQVNSDYSSIDVEFLRKDQAAG